jgi:hypothetical protein
MYHKHKDKWFTHQILDTKYIYHMVGSQKILNNVEASSKKKCY